MAPASLGGLDGAQMLLLCQHLGRKLGSVRKVRTDSLHLLHMTWRNNDLDEEMQATPSETTDLVRFQSQELDRVQRLEKQRHKSGAHLAQICTAFSAAYARLAERQKLVHAAYRKLRARLVEQLGEAKSSHLPTVRDHVPPRVRNLQQKLTDNNLGAEDAALDPGLLQRLEQLQWKQILVRDDHKRVHCIPPPSSYAPIKQSLHADALQAVEAQSLEQHRNSRQTERLPDGTVRCIIIIRLNTRAVRLRGAVLRHHVSRQVQPRMRALEAGCAAQELRVEWVQYMVDIARYLCVLLEIEHDTVSAVLEA